LNLAANARDALPRGGSVTIGTERIRIEGVSLRMEDAELQPGSYARLTFADSGLGMDEETRRRVFEPFFTTKETGKGTGLGLATTYGIVAQHNGVIECFSQPGMGTAFRLYLPLNVSAVATPELRQSAAAPVWDGGNETVLLAEDDAATRNLVREILQETGYRVIEAVDGQQAVEQLERHLASIQLAILDVIMPKLNGREVYQKITELKPELPVIFTSGYAADAFREGERPEQDFNFLAKPVTPEKLLGMIRKVLDG
jgi:CheY-like chemotaxis protein